MAALAACGNLSAAVSLPPTAVAISRHSSPSKVAVFSRNPIVSAAAAGGKAASSTSWAPGSWKSKRALQIPAYTNQEELESVLRSLETYPPLVFAGEARRLEERLAEAAVGRAFLLQGGDCAESFKEFNANNIRDTFRVLLQMGVVLTFGGQMPIIKVGPFFQVLNKNVYANCFFRVICNYT